MKPRRVLSLALAALAIGGLLFASLPVEAAPGGRPAYSLSDSLVAYWKLDEASGTRLDELNGCGGSGCDLTDNNTVTQNPGKLNNAAQFTSANSEYFSRADHADLSMGDIDFTIAAWVYLDAKGTYRGFVSKGIGGANQQNEYQIYYATSDRFSFAVGNGTTSGQVVANNLGSPSTASWYFIVVWHDAAADTVNIQVNNGTADSASYSSGGFDSGGVLYLGRLNTGSYLDGRMDGVGIWKRVLSAGERTALYNSGNGCDYPFTDCEATPTPTITATATSTNTATATSTNTATATSTNTATATDTPTPTATATVTATATETDTPGGPTPTDTDTPTPTGTPTITLTPGPSATPTITGTPNDVYWYEIELTSGNVLRIERRWDYGALFVGLALLIVAIVLLARFGYDFLGRWF